MRCLLLLLFLVTLVKGGDVGDSDLRAWFRRVNDVSSTCDDFGDLSDSEVAEEPLFTVVDCQQNGARWDYKYQVMGNKGKPAKRGAPFSGRAVLTFARPGGEHGFKDGFKTGKCLRPGHSPAVKSLSGQFVDDALEGRVVMEFFDDSITVGFARRNRLIGAVRSFSSTDGLAKSVRMNMTTVRTGQVLYEQDRFGYLRILAREKGSSERPSTSSSSDSRIIFTKDFGEVLNCRPADSTFFDDCRVMDPAQVKVRQCMAYLSSEGVDCRGGKEEEQEQEEPFLFYAPTSERRRPSNLAEEGELCPEGEDMKVEGEGKAAAAAAAAVRKDFEEWLRRVEANGTGEPFWSSHYDPSERPLDPDDPEVDILLPLFEGRPGFEPRGVRIVSADRVLFSGEMSGGRIKGKVDADSARLPDWRAPLRIELSDHPSVSGTAGLSIGAYGVVDLQETGGDVVPPLYVLSRLRRGRLHGQVRGFGRVPSDPSSLCGAAVFPRGLGFVGRYEEGRAVGWAWRGLLGDSWVGGRVDPEGRFTGEEMAFVNQDIRTAFVGKFENGLMVRGREAEVTGSRCEGGIKVLTFSAPHGPDYHYNPPTADALGDQPTLGDPLDSRYVYLGPSPTFPAAGEGTHARTEVPPQTVYALYSGLMWTDDERKKQAERINKDFEERNITDDTHPEKIASWKYRHSIRPCALTIDIPAVYGDTQLYRGTLGHKINHKFNPTTVFVNVESARFGIINALKTGAEPVKEGEEFFVSYGYSPTVNLPWYREEYKRFAREHPELVNEELLKTLTSDGEEGIGVGEAKAEEGEGEGLSEEEEKEKEKEEGDKKEGDKLL